MMTKADISRNVAASNAGAAIDSSLERNAPRESAMKPLCCVDAWGSDGGSTDASNEQRDRNALSLPTLVEDGSREVNEAAREVNFARADRQGRMDAFGRPGVSVR